MDYEMIIAENLASFRDERELTLAEVARRSGLYRHQIRAYEAARTLPQIPTLIKLAETYDVSLIELLEPDRAAVGRGARKG